MDEVARGMREREPGNGYGYVTVKYRQERAVEEKHGGNGAREILTLL